MRDRIVIPGIPVKASVGCTEEERREPQSVVIDIEMRCDLARAAQSDSIADAIDYVLVRNEVAGVVSSRPYALIETIAERVASRLLEAFPVEETLVRVRKPSALELFGVPWAGVEIVRGRNG